MRSKKFAKDTKNPRKRILHLQRYFANFIMFDSTISLLILIAYCTIVVTFLVLILRFLLPLAFKTKKVESRPKVGEGVSVIIAAKNEAKNLNAHLSAILEQNYPLYEVIVASDHSNDNTIEVLNEFKTKYPKLSILDIQDWHGGGKKDSLTKAIFHAKYPLLLFTDADCKPVSDSWINEMISEFNTDVDIVIGYGAYHKKPGLLNAIIRYDTVEVALLSFGFAKAGMAYMGVGRNLAYRKRLFINSKGFVNHLHIPSGDDDLFVQENARKYNVAFVTSPDSKTVSIPKDTLSKWWKQKRRHQSTSTLYKLKFKLLLGWYTLSKFIMYLIWPIAFFTTYTWSIIIVFVSAVTIHFITFSLVAKMIQEQKLSYGTPFYSFLISLNTLYLGVANFFIKDKSWK
tara:strand:+ start:4458 stop:5657 length:1200 start_codon:yes stop_codon:yes gene_type:complete